VSSCCDSVTRSILAEAGETRMSCPRCGLPSDQWLNVSGLGYGGGSEERLCAPLL
jgi:hypothetical protein